MQWLTLILILPYFFLLLKIYRNLRKIRPFSFRRNNGFFVTVIIACRNEDENIIPFLQNISQQDYPAAYFEVIIVDDNSVDRTFEIASGFMGMENLKVIKTNGKGKKTAIRTGVGASSGSLIITTDCDCLMGEKWISTIVAFYNENKPDMIICPVTLKSKPGFFGRFQELEFLSLQGVSAGSAIAGMSSMCNGANLAFTREVYLEHSENLHYEIASGDDVFFLHSLKKAKRSKIMWLESPESIVTASPAKTVMLFLNQRRRWISKGYSYNDKFTVALAIVTFVTIVVMMLLLIAGLLVTEFLWIFIVAFALKSVPDFLILFNTTSRYDKRRLMKWFLPSQVIYPFYVLAVVCYSVITGRRSSF
jgi:biofilm PGA synthesis N-glycosyltransferase PgaC